MSERYDLLVRNATIVDGSGAQAFLGDLGVRGERIVAVGHADGKAHRTIDGSGLVLCPGFVDMHSHADLTLMDHPLAPNLLLQGITTFLGGHCGSTLAPVCESGCRSLEHAQAPITWRTFGEWLQAAERAGIGINYAPLVGHNTIRQAVMGDDFKRRARPAEIKDMEAHVNEAMEAGAFGLSSFFDPSPGEYASRDEIVDLCRVAKRRGGFYAPHTRHTQSQWPSEDPLEYGYGVFHGPMEDVWVGAYRGYLEALEIARAAAIPVHIAHLSTAFALRQPHPDYLEAAAARATLEYLDQAKAAGIDVTFDLMPYAASISTQCTLLSAFSRWAEPMGKTAFLETIKGEGLRNQIRQVQAAGRLKFGMVHTRADPYWADCFTIVRCAKGAWNGRVLGDLARETGSAPLELIFDILVADADARWVQHLDRRGTFPCNAEFLKHPLGMVSTDTTAMAMEAPSDVDALPAPIAFGLYPHYLSVYVRDRGVLPLEEAIRKATGFPAQRLGLADRGVLRPGAYADLVLLDMDQLRDNATFLDPVQAPDGIVHVVVNGTVVTDGKTHLGKLAGKVLRRT